MHAASSTIRGHLGGYGFHECVYMSELDKQGLPFDLPGVVCLLKDRPELKEINAHVHQCRLVENKKKVLFAVDAGGEYGFGHLTRCLELAGQITERLAWSTHFLVDDHQAQAIIDKSGCKTHWGAFGRPANLNSDPKASPIETVFSAYDLLIFDIFDQRGPKGGWRSKLSRAIKCVVIENLQPWTSEADMIVLPNLLDKHASGLSFQKPLAGSDTTQSDGAKSGWR